MTHPKWKYHRTLQPHIVPDAETEEALGEGWADSPTAFIDEPEEEELPPPIPEAVALPAKPKSRAAKG